MKNNFIFLAVLYVTQGLVLTPAIAGKTCAEYGLTVGTVCGDGGVLPPHSDCLNRG